MTRAVGRWTHVREMTPTPEHRCRTHSELIVRDTIDLLDAHTRLRRSEAAARRTARMAELVAEPDRVRARRAPVTPCGRWRGRQRRRTPELVARAMVTTISPAPARAPASSAVRLPRPPPLVRRPHPGPTGRSAHPRHRDRPTPVTSAPPRRAGRAGPSRTVRRGLAMEYDSGHHRRDAVGPGRCPLELARHLQQEILPAVGRHQLHADGQTVSALAQRAARSPAGR